MTGLIEFFTTDHRAIDAKWARVEETLGAGDAAAAQAAWAAFSEAMEGHFRMEEDELFPAFEEATGMRGGGPTFVMREEHRQMRGLLSQMGSLMQSGELGEALDQGDTLLMIIQQHNAKEEGMLYPMAEQHIGAQWESLRSRLPR